LLIGNPQGIDPKMRWKFTDAQNSSRPADCQSAKQQTASLRYDEIKPGTSL